MLWVGLRGFLCKSFLGTTLQITSPTTSNISNNITSIKKSKGGIVGNLWDRVSYQIKILQYDSYKMN